MMYLVALTVFVTVQCVNVFALGFDLYLKFWAKTHTITEMVWARPCLCVPILLWQVVGFVSLAIHFYAKPAWFRD